jgi:hypothetical protein
MKSLDRAGYWDERDKAFNQWLSAVGADTNWTEDGYWDQVRKDARTMAEKQLDETTPNWRTERPDLVGLMGELIYNKYYSQYSQLKSGMLQQWRIAHPAEQAILQKWDIGGVNQAEVGQIIAGLQAAGE